MGRANRIQKTIRRQVRKQMSMDMRLAADGIALLSLRKRVVAAWRVLRGRNAFTGQKRRHD